jgi:hypothetical protein
MASKNKSIFLGLVLTFCFYCSQAQPGVGPGGGPPGGGGNPGGGPPVPITGIEILLVAGGALGLKRFMASKKSKNT